MARALWLGVIGAAAMLGAPMAMAGGAPAAYYPSLGYGQTPPDYGPADYGPPEGAPPPAFAPGPRDGPDYRREPPPPPERYERRAYERGGYGAERHERYESRSEYDAGYDSGWRGAQGGYDHDRGYDYDHDYAYGRDDRVATERSYAAESRQEYDYDSGWRTRAYEAPVPREAPPGLCRYARPEGPPPPQRPMCAPAYGSERGYDHRYAYEERVPDTFFADAGGVGPDEFEWSDGGGGEGYVVGGASSGAFAAASASASARVNVGVGVRIGRHGGGHRGGGHMPHGCGCRK